MVGIAELTDATNFAQAAYFSTRNVAIEKTPEGKVVDGANPSEQYATFGRNLLTAAGLVIHRIPESISETYENLRDRRSLKAVAAAGLTAVHLYFAEIGGTAGLTAFRDHLPLNGTTKEVASLGLIGLIDAAIAWWLTRYNQKHLVPDLAPGPKPELGKDTQELSFKEKVADKVRRFSSYLPKMGLSLYPGEPVNALTQYYSKREVIGHAALFGAVGIGLYATGADYVGALNNPVTPLVAAGVLLGHNYAFNVFEPTEKQIAEEARLLRQAQDTGTAAS